MRVLSGAPQAGYSPVGWTRRRPSPPTSWTRGPSRCRSPPSWASRPRCAACSPSSRRSTSTGHNIANANTPGYTRAGRRACRDRRPPFSTTSAGRPARHRRRRRRLPAHPRQLPRRPATARRRCSRARPQAQQDGLEPGRARRSTSRPTTASRRCSASYWSAWQNVVEHAREHGHAPGARPVGGRASRTASTALSTQLTTIQSQTGQNVTLTLNQVNSIGAPDRAAERRDLEVARLPATRRTTCSTSATCCSTSSRALGNVAVTDTAPTGRSTSRFGGASLVTGDAPSSDAGARPT